MHVSKKIKTIWIINQYASTPETSMGGRHYYLAKELSKRGYSVYVVAASYTHLLREPPLCKSELNIEQVSGFNFVWVRVSKYSNAHSIKRILASKVI